MKQFIEFKKAAKKSLLHNYVLFVILMAIASFLGTSSLKSLALFSTNASSVSSAWSVVRQISAGNIDEANKEATDAHAFETQQSKNYGAVQVGREKGVISDFINNYVSGSFWAAIASSILSITGSVSFLRIFIILLALLFIAFKTIFISAIFKVIYSRIYLECRTYKKFTPSTVIFLFRTGTWIKASLAYFRRNFFLFLWDLTIVGGVIKYFSYAMVTYILAENPSISGKDAISLSERMMKGHKWELFLFKLSFIGWKLLSPFTGNLLDLFFINPYYYAAEAEYFAYIRKLAKEQRIEGIELLNNQYLYKKAPVHEIKSAYADVIEIMKEAPVELQQPSKLRAFFQNNFGLVFSYDKQEDAYRKEMTKKAQIHSYEGAVNQEAYPVRLCPLKPHHARKHLEHTYYIRHYSISSLVMMFFVFCFIGWLWEVSIHIVRDGVFVNRGVLHGPWLPIYGSGAVLFLLILYRFRNNMLKEFGMTVLVSGIIEYSTSFALSKLHNGEKWWDYTGYFLNINGRICAEGLLVFGLGGIAVVYFIAPMLDNVFLKIKINILRAVCVVLLIIFAADLVYSHFYPNTGKGITDYAFSNYDTTVYSSESILPIRDNKMDQHT